MYNGLISGSNLIDYRKPFDLVDHSTFLKKLAVYGVAGKSFEWFNSCLEDRKQKVMTKVVSQGSILGPLLFLLFINDLPLEVSNSTVEIYDDDTTQIVCGGTIEEVETMLTDELRHLSRWARDNKMVLNQNKTKSVIVCSKPKFRGLHGRSYCENR